jgi:putative transposase
VKYAYITAHRKLFRLDVMCRVLEVSRTGYHASLHRKPSARARATAHLTLHIRAMNAKSKRADGAPLIHAELTGQGIACGRHRVARLMQADGLRAKRTKTSRVATQSAHPHPIAENLLARRFSPAQWPVRDRAWVTDMTYLSTSEGWLCVATVIDLTSRRVVGWAASATLARELPIAALRMAIARRQSAPGTIVHSDRGSQYACAAYRQILAQHQLAAGMSRVANCWDDAVAESFFATLKWDLVFDADWATRRTAITALIEYFELYNHERRHSSLGCRSPAQYESEGLTRANVA